MLKVTIRAHHLWGVLGESGLTVYIYNRTSQHLLFLVTLTSLPKAQTHGKHWSLHSNPVTLLNLWLLLISIFVWISWSVLGMGVGYRWNPCFPKGHRSLQLLYYLVWEYKQSAKRSMPFLYISVGSAAGILSKILHQRNRLTCLGRMKTGLQSVGSREEHKGQQGA